MGLQTVVCRQAYKHMLTMYALYCSMELSLYILFVVSIDGDLFFLIIQLLLHLKKIKMVMFSYKSPGEQGVIYGHSLDPLESGFECECGYIFCACVWVWVKERGCVYVCEREIEDQGWFSCKVFEISPKSEIISASYLAISYHQQKLFSRPHIHASEVLWKFNQKTWP